MIDIKFLRETPDIVKQNIKNKFQDHKLGLVDEVIELDASSEQFSRKRMICVQQKPYLQTDWCSDGTGKKRRGYGIKRAGCQRCRASDRT